MNPAHASPTLRWSDKLAIAHHEMWVAALIVSDVLEQRAGTEADFSRLAEAAMRLRALMEFRNGFG